ncbi:MAG: histidine kinase, partial [Ferruginibacter sp.]
MRLLFIILFLLSKQCFAQTSQHISTDQGLLTNMLTTVIRDRNNYMWIGSYNGLHKHEGSRIKTFKRIGKDSASISGGEMHGLFEDKDGFIWIGTTAGLDRINPVTNEIKHYTIRNPKSTSSYVGYIYSVFQDKEGYIWFRTDVAMFRLNPGTGSFAAIPNAKDSTGMPVFNSGYMTGISTASGLWMQTTGGMVFYEYSSRKFYHRYYNPHNKKIFDLSNPPNREQGTSDMGMDADSNMYFINNDSFLIKYNLHTEKLDSFKFERPVHSWFCCYSIGIDSHQNPWIGFRHGGVLVFNSQLKIFTPVKFENNNSLISSNYIYSICKDYTGRMWITSDKGVDIVDLYNNAVQKKYLSNDPDFTNLAYDAGIISAGNDGSLYIPFYNGGLMKVNTASGNIQHWRTDTAIKRLNYVFDDNRSGLLVAANKRLYKLNIENNKLVFKDINTAYATAVSKTKGDLVWMYKENDNSIYFKKSNGVFYYFNGTDSLEKIQADGFKQLACISRDEKYLYYITKELNLVKRELSTKQSVVIPLQDKLKTVDFSFSNPRAVTDDGQGNIWITSQNGLLRYQTASQKIFTYTTQQGLSHSFTFAVCSDSKGRVWVGSLGGVDYYNAATGMFQNVISYSSGTYMDAFGSCLVLKNDTLFFNAGNHLFRVVPDEFLKARPVPLQLKINEVLINSKAVEWQKDNLLEDLSFGQNRVEIYFSLLDFATEQHVRYFYYLEGLEKGWIETGRPEILYNSLPAGKYILHLKALDAGGAKIKQTISLPINIRPPYWQTWWFRVLISLIIASLIYLLFRQRVKTIRNKSTIKQQLAELEAKAIRAQMNPHFIFNSLNAIQECIVTEQVDVAYDYLSRFSKLLRMVLDNSEKNFISLTSELETIRLYLSLEALRFSQSFTYSIELKEELDKDDIYIPSLLLQPFVENAIWHGLINKEGEKKLLLQFEEKDGYLECIIYDNGV